jgi:hypothetical protein
MTDTDLRAALEALPDRIVVGANGAYWRDYGDHYSMCPVSDDNDPVVPIATYVRLDAAPPAPLTHEPGEPHRYELECPCGQRGMVTVSIEPQVAADLEGEDLAR